MTTTGGPRDPDPAPDPGWVGAAAPRISVDDPRTLVAAAGEAAAARGPTDPVVIDTARRHLAALATPPGALAELADLALALVDAAGQLPPAAGSRPALVVAAGDHGVHVRGPSPWPQQVGTAVAELLCAGRAGASAAAHSVGARVAVLDAGLVTPPAAHPRLVHGAAPPRRGTRDLSVEDALTSDDVASAVALGLATASALVADGADLLITGDVGIANTTSSAALIAALTGVDTDHATGSGSSDPDDLDLLARKRALVRAGRDRALGRPALAALAAVGGTEHAALVGVVLAGAAHGVPVLLDGVITAAAALVAVGAVPAARRVLVAGHRSPEPGATIALEALGLRPLIDLGLRLGEGSGALLAVPLVRTAARLLTDVARLEEVVLPGPDRPGPDRPGTTGPGHPRSAPS